MCAIAGIINQLDSPVSEEQIKAITQAAAHRGPDGVGYFFYQNLALGHRRLSIFDTSDKGSQPMKFQDKYTIIFNGAIYNFLEIRNELLKHGYVFTSETDTEVILAAYDFWGKDCVAKFNGMWAFALFDQEKKKLFCSRDRFGVKPFYYGIASSHFFFGSEIKQLLTQIASRVNYPMLMDYLIYNLEEHTTQTFFTGIHKLPAGHNLEYDLSTHTYRTTRYYQLQISKEIKTLTELEIVAQFQQLFSESIQLRMRSDVRLGTCLSGGLDSSYVATIANQFYNSNQNQFTAVTCGSEDQSNDETKYAAQLIKAKAMNWIVGTPTVEDFSSHFDRVIHVQEEPFSNLSNFMQYFVMQLARQSNLKVLLDGQGGDETLLGYNRYYPLFFPANPMHWISHLQSISANSNLSWSSLVWQNIYFKNTSLRKQYFKLKHRQINPAYYSLADDTWIDRISRAYLDSTQMQLLEIQHTQLPRLLRYEDRNSMNFGIESRLPFLDYQLVEFSLSLPENLKMKSGWSKYLLRKAMTAKVPDSITWRKQKIGFEAPEMLWMDRLRDYKSVTENSAILNTIYKNKAPLTNNLHLRWKLYNIASWERVYKVSAS